MNTFNISGSIIFNRGGGMWFSVTYFLKGCIANRHTMSGGGMVKKWQKKRRVFSEWPLNSIKSQVLAHAVSATLASHTTKKVKPSNRAWSCISCELSCRVDLSCASFI